MSVERSALNVERSGEAGRAVFLSYASQDAEAARRICEALRASGVEVWFDADGGLEHGDEWDAKIRRQIKECVLFIPVISANTQARHEGYFRIEWELAAQRVMGIASGMAFILPIVIDDTREPDALVPDRFRMVQWTRAVGGVVTPEVKARYLKLWSHRTGALKHAASQARSPTSEAASSTHWSAAGRPLGGRLLRLVSAAVAVALIGVVGWILLRPETPATPTADPARRSASPITPTPGVPLAEDQELVAPEKDPLRPPRTTDAAAAKPASPSAPAAKSVAVLAFANQSDDKANEYFSDGIAEELLTVLQKLPGLRVAARTSAWSFKGKNRTAQEVGEKLGVAHVVEGSVQKYGNRVKITARLSRAATNEEVWSKSFGPLELTDVFAMQSELAQAIVGELRARLGGGTPDAAAKAEIQTQVLAAVKGGTRNPEAYQLFLQARFLANQFSLDNLAKASVLFRRAVDIDPKFAIGWAVLGRASAVQGEYATAEPELRERFATARDACQRALTLEPGLVETQLALFEIQTHHDFDWRAARESVRFARALAPSDATVIHAAAVLARLLGDVAGSVELGRQALALDPVNPEIRRFLAYSLSSAGRFEEADAEYRRALELSPDLASGRGALAMNLARMGRLVEALVEAEKEPAAWGRFTALGYTYWAMGNKEKADEALQNLIKTSADVAAIQVAQLYAQRPEKDLAFQWLERAYRQRDSGIMWCKTDRHSAKLRDDPRWPAFLKKIGLSDEQLK